MKKVSEKAGEVLLGLFLWAAVIGLLLFCSMVATLMLFVAVEVVKALALRVAMAPGLCGMYPPSEVLDRCLISPWWTIFVLIAIFAGGAGLYYGWCLFADIVGLTPAATKPGEGDGHPHREADTSTDPRWQMLRMAAHIGYLRARYPETLEEHDCYLSVGDNAIIADYTVSHNEAWTATANAGVKPPSNFAPPHPKRPA